MVRSLPATARLEIGGFLQAESTCYQENETSIPALEGFLLVIKPLYLYLQTVLDSLCSFAFVLYLHFEDQTLRELQCNLLLTLAKYDFAFRYLVSQMVQESTQV